jgi:peptidoglycan-associated lipoprotein
MRVVRLLSAVGIVVLGGCSWLSTGPQPPLADHPLTKAPIVAVVPAGTRADPAPPPPAPLAEGELPSVIYFDFDAYTVKDEYRPLLQAHAKRLLADPSLHLRIDAHTDEHGPADYNLELARMRAVSVQKQLLSLGVPATQLQIVGHGRDKAARGKASASVASSRRVELSYR